MSAKICIIDYGVGNLGSLEKAIRLYSNKVLISDDPQEIGQADALILPGVGSFSAGMQGLKIRGLVETIKTAAATKKPILGICLGAQLMLSKGFEFGECEGLGLITGQVVRLPKLTANAKIPHIGWNKIYPVAGQSWIKTPLEKISPSSAFYFVHSFILEPAESSKKLAICKYGGYEFTAAIKNGNIYGMQFHPEKSGEVGLEIIKSFIESI